MKNSTLIITFSLIAAIFLHACSDKTVYSSSFDSDPLEAGEWTLCGQLPSHANVKYMPSAGVDSTGCLYLSSTERMHLYAKHKLTGLDTTKLYRMSAKIKTKGVSEGRGAILAVKTEKSEQIWNASEFMYGDNDWTEVYIDFVPAKDGTAEICCQLGNFGGTYNGGTALGEVWYDDVRVAEVTREQMYFRSGKHITLALDRDKVCIPDSVADRWLSELDKVYEAYMDLVGDCPYDGDKIMIVTTPGIEPGYWALAGNPILWNNHVGIDKLLQRTMDNDDWNFGILHEIGHTFSPGTVANNGKWNWNDEIFANFRMSYALEACGGAVSQRDVIYRGDAIRDYYKIFYDETIGQGIAKNNGDALHYTFLRIKDKYGWDVYKKAFRELYTLAPEKMSHLSTDWEKMLFFLEYVSKAAGEDVTKTCYTAEELKLIEQSLK